MKVYLASWFASKNDIAARADQLRSQGIEVTARWLEERVKPTVQIHEVEDVYLRETAEIDVYDILTATAFVLNVPSAEDLKATDIPVAGWARGGRHFESGLQYATMLFFKYLPQHIQDRGPRHLLLVGHRENVFHYLDGVNKSQADGLDLPTIELYETWPEAYQRLLVLASEEVLVSAAG